MTLRIMQPYFMPYIGYWQLMAAADTYVLYDDVNYIKGCWGNARIWGNRRVVMIVLGLYKNAENA